MPIPPIPMPLIPWWFSSLGYTLFFDVTEENLLSRRKKRNTSDRLEKEELNFHKKVYKGYNYIKEKYQGDENFYIVDANKDISEVTSYCISVILDNYRRKKWNL